MSVVFSQAVHICFSRRRVPSDGVLYATCAPTAVPLTLAPPAFYGVLQLHEKVVFAVNDNPLT
jgi:hypothetical protein